MAGSDTQRRVRFWLRLPLRILATMVLATIAAGLAAGIGTGSAAWGFAAAFGFVIVAMAAAPVALFIATRPRVLAWFVPRLIARWLRRLRPGGTTIESRIIPGRDEPLGRGQ